MTTNRRQLFLTHEAHAPNGTIDLGLDEPDDDVRVGATLFDEVFSDCLESVRQNLWARRRIRTLRCERCRSFFCLGRGHFCQPRCELQIAA